MDFGNFTFEHNSTNANIHSIVSFNKAMFPSTFSSQHAELAESQYVIFSGAFDKAGNLMEAKNHKPLSMEVDMQSEHSHTPSSTTLATSDTYSTTTHGTSLSFVTSNTGTMGNMTDDTYNPSDCAGSLSQLKVKDVGVEQQTVEYIRKWCESLTGSEFCL